jgi:hypothetical protein
MKRSRLVVSFSLALISSLIVMACGSDDSTGGPDSGADARTGGDATSGADADADGAEDSASLDAHASDADADRNTVDAPSTDAPVTADAGTDAAPHDDASDDGASSIDAAMDIDGAMDIDAGNDAGVTDAFFVDDASDLCNALANGGPEVPETRAAMDPPANGAGGTIPFPSFWYLTKWEVFTGVGGVTGPTGTSRKTAMRFTSATTYEKVTVDVGSGQPDEHDSRTYSTNGTTLYSIQICPSQDTLSSDYSVQGNGTTLLLIAGPVVYTFTRQ